MSRSSKSGSRFCKPRAMLFASSRISVENDTVAGNAFEPKNEPACGRVGHEVVALILTGIRVRIGKRRREDRPALSAVVLASYMIRRDWNGKRDSRYVDCLAI